jgi:hypothetical protein
MMTRSGRRLVWLPLTLLLGVACERGPSPEVQQQLDQLAAVQAEKDSLFDEVAENARLMNEINAELSKIRGVDQAVRDSNSESPTASSRAQLVEKVRVVTARLTESEQRLAASRRRLREISTQSDTLQAQIARLDDAVSDFEAVIQSQRNTIADLGEQVQQMHVANLALQDTLATMDEREHTVYYVVGTEQELLDRGIVVKEGGSRVLFIFGKRGQTLQPARDLDPSMFTAIDMRKVTEIALPDSAESYRIASRQDLTALATQPDEHGRITGDAIRIAQPESFWLPSKFLIIVKA